MSPGFLHVFTFVLCATLVQAVPVMAHDQALHDATPTTRQTSSAQPRVFAAETLRIPNAPVIDSEYHSEGFVSRFQGMGQLLISFTYTGCETLCPISNAVLQQVDQRLSAMSDEVPLHIVTLSIDPVRDTPAALEQTRTMLKASDHWSWLTAAPQDNRLLLESFGIDPSLLEEHDPMFLLGDLVTGEFVRIIGMPDPDRIFHIVQSNIN